MDGVLVRDVSGEDKNCHYIVFKGKRKIYKVKQGVELELVKVLNVSWRWYGDDLDRLLSQGYTLIENLSDL